MAATTSAGSARRARGGRRASHGPRTGIGTVLAALAVVTAAGCGGAVDPGGEPARGERASRSRPAQPPDGPSTGRGASAQPSVPAADGRDVAACTDGTCEVAVSAPVTIRFRGPGGPATLSVTEIGPNRVEYTVESGNGRSRASTNGPGQGCITVLRRNGGGNSCGRLGAAGPSPRPDAVVIQAAAGQDGTAVLHIVSE